jgi:type IV secretory pathway VirJ component
VILLTGDGGWAGIDQQLAAALAQHGVPVVGWNSLRYYWNPRAPARASADLTRLIEHYLARWSRRDVVLVGYSFGADVLPFLVRRLDTATRARVRALVLLAPSQTASFEVHVSEWLPGGNQGDLPTIPEARQLGSMPVLCLYGREDHESICPRVATAGWRATPLEGKHHFGGDYEQLASSVLQFLGP